MSSKEIELLQAQVKELQELVQKQNQVIAKTGQQLIEFQVKSQKQALLSLPDQHKTSHIDTSEFATNEDIVQMVGELQVQLDAIEQRNILRIVNSTKEQDDDLLAPLTNQDGEAPAENTKFPATLKNFKDLTSVELYKIAKFYELVPSLDSEKEKLDDYLAGKVEEYTIDDELSDTVVLKELEIHFSSKSDLDELFNELARYLGIKVRKGDASW